MDIAEYIVSLKRITASKTDADLADKIGVARQTVTSWRRRGSIPLSVELKIADIYGPDAAFSPEFRYAVSAREERAISCFFLMIFAEQAKIGELQSNPERFENWAAAIELNRDYVRKILREIGFLTEESWPMIAVLKHTFDVGLMPELEVSLALWTKEKQPK
jgi:transcriptional regulator with XRE-family HTH domain